MSEADAIRVLVVDDEADFASAIAERLVRRGFLAEAAFSAAEGLAHLGSSPPDVIVLDLKMPGMDGLTALREIRKRRPDVQVVVLTGHGTVASGVEGMQGGGGRFPSEARHHRGSLHGHPSGRRALPRRPLRTRRGRRRKMNLKTLRVRLRGRFAPLRRVLVALVGLAMALDAAAAPAKPAKKLVNIADTRALPPGLTRWIADVYNTSYWAFGLLVVAVMAAMGLVLGFGFDRLMARLGIDLGRLSHHE